MQNQDLPLKLLLPVAGPLFLTPEFHMLDSTGQVKHRFGEQQCLTCGPQDGKEVTTSSTALRSRGSPQESSDPGCIRHRTSFQSHHPPRSSDTPDKRQSEGAEKYRPCQATLGIWLRCKDFACCDVRCQRSSKDMVFATSCSLD